MGISGIFNPAIFNPAIFNTRGAKALMYAQAGVMRADASRANATSPKAFVAINGVHYATARDVDGQQVDNETLDIQETDGETPNTCAFQVRGFVPSDGQDVIVTLGSKNNLDRLFAGTVITDTSGYVGTPANQHDQVNVIDYTWQLTRQTITQRWTNVSATTIAQEIIAHAGRGFTSKRVAVGLPTIDEFTVTSATHIAALKALADRIGATAKATYDKDVRFGISADPTQTDPTTLTATSALATEMTDLAVTRDLSQVITRQPVEGGGSTAITEVLPGDTILAVEEATWYSAVGGLVASGPQHVTYTGKQVGGGGAFVGPGASPTTAPNVTPQAGSGLGTGLYKYAYTDVTPSGESLPSPLALVTTGPISAPATLPTLHDPMAGAGPDPGFHYWGISFVAGSGETLATVSTNNESPYDVAAPGAGSVFQPHGVVVSPSGWAAGQVIRFRFTAHNVAGETTVGTEITHTIEATGGNFWGPQLVAPTLPAGATGVNAYASRDGGATFHRVAASLYSGSTFFYITGHPTLDTFPTPPGSNGANVRTCQLTTIPVGPPGTTARKIYRTAALAAYAYGNFKLVATLSDNTTTTFNDTVPDASLGAAAPGSNTTALNQVSLSGIAVGPSPTSSRKVYRTAVGASQLKLLTTLSDNTTTTYSDSTADGSLGANAPTTDTSGLATVSGQVLAGSTSLLTTSATPFSATGGWVISGQQRIRYTGLSGNTLTGIPATGRGSIEATLQYGAALTAAPALTGIPATGAGSILYTIRQGDPVNLRMVIDDLAAQAAIAVLMGGTDDGVIEGALIQDGRISETEARARGQATIDQRKSLNIALAYSTRDTNTHASRTIGSTLTQPACVGSFKLRSVAISNFHPGRWPTRHAQASSDRFTLEDLLRQARSKTEATS